MALFKKDLLQLSEQWLQDARVLEGAQRVAGAYHAGGVALECMLKAKIAKSTQPEEFPDKRLADKAWQHDPTELLKLGDLARFMDQAKQAVQTNWATVKDWKIESRYTLVVSQV